MLRSRAIGTSPGVVAVRLNRGMRRRGGALATVAALALLAGCTQEGQDEPEAPSPAPATPEASEAASEEPEAEQESAEDQYLHDLRNQMQLGDFTLGGEYYANVADNDLIEAGNTFCDYVESDDATGDYQIDLSFVTVLHFPESVQDAEDANAVKLAVAAVANLCPEHTEPMLEDFQEAAAENG